MLKTHFSNVDRPYFTKYLKPCNEVSVKNSRTVNRNTLAMKKSSDFDGFEGIIFEINTISTMSFHLLTVQIAGTIISSIIISSLKFQLVEMTH